MEDMDLVNMLTWCMRCRDVSSNTLGLQDREGVLNVVEPDLEVVEPDFDGEGVLYVVEANLEVVELDFDGEGVLNVVEPNLEVVEPNLEVVEPDFDGEGVLNIVEPDLEGEGVWNVGPGGRTGCALFLRPRLPSESALTGEPMVAQRLSRPYAETW